MSGLQKITTDYNEQEDRLTIAGLTEKNETVLFWLTMRLASRLIGHCLGILEKDVPESKNNSKVNEQSEENIQSFAQQSAEAQLNQEAAVKVTDNSPQLLIVEIDIKRSSAGVTLIFKQQIDNHYEISLNNQQLRQWLGMLYTVWQKTEWPTNIWPDWILTSRFQSMAGVTLIH